MCIAIEFFLLYGCRSVLIAGASTRLSGKQTFQIQARDVNRFGRDLAAAIGWLSDLTIDASNIVFELSRLKSYTCGVVSSLH
jgi:hypothetical protein